MSMSMSKSNSTKNGLAALAFLAVLVVAIAGVFRASPADALANPTSRVAAKSVTLTTAAADISSSLGGGLSQWKSCRILNDSATVAYVGGSDVDSTDGYPVCNASGCDQKALTVDGSGVYALVGTGTLSVNVICAK